MEITYLATPYTHDDAEIMEARYEAVTVAAAYLLRKDIQCFSPITHTHPIKIEHGSIGESFGVWEEYDLHILEHACSLLTVLMLDGWESSVGVTAELAHGRSLGYDVMWLDPLSCGLIRQPIVERWETNRRKKVSYVLSSV